MEELKSRIRQDRMPDHVAIIMDGNGRWAREHGRDRVEGHRQGVKSVRVVVEAASEIDLKYLTLYTFSTENWNRPKEEINALFDLLVVTINEQLEDLHKNNVKVMLIGEEQLIPKSILSEINRARELTKNNTGLNLIMAFSYSARWDLVSATKRIADKCKAGELNSYEIDDNCIKAHLSTSSYPDPDLLIRTSGEYRISNFLLWELAYSEFYFCKKYWPEFSKDDFYGAIIEYQQRDRRFGKVSEQLK